MLNLRGILEQQLEVTILDNLVFVQVRLPLGDCSEHIWLAPTVSY